MIAARDPALVAERVAALSSIAGYRLRPMAPQPIHDRYLDTAQRALAAGGVALRFRTIDHERFLTVKGPSRRTAWGTAERLEFEAGWSAESLRRMIDVLHRAGVTLPRISGSTGAPLEILRALGLDVVQDRHTHRRPRRVTRADDPRGAVLAELAVDAVVYRLEVGRVRLYQIEIEAASAGAAPVVRAILDRLAAQYGGQGETVAAALRLLDRPQAGAAPPAPNDLPDLPDALRRAASEIESLRRVAKFARKS